MKIKVKDINDIVVITEYGDFAPEIYGQIAQNLQTVSTRVRPGPLRNEALQIACFGPSLKTSLEALQHDGPIMTCSGAHDLLLTQGWTPTWHIECDWRPHKAEFVKNPDERVEYLIASAMHPKALEYLKGYQVAIWNMDMEPYYTYPQGETVFRSLGCVGLQAITMAHFLGFRDLIIHGMDCSFELDGMRHSPGSFEYPEKDSNIWVKAGNRVFLTSMPFVCYAKMFVEVLKNMPDLKVTLAGDGLLQEYCRQLANPRS